MQKIKEILRAVFEKNKIRPAYLCASDDALSGVPVIVSREAN